MNPPAHPLRTANQLGLLLRSARKARKFTQGALASKLNISQSRVSQLEIQPGNLTARQLMDWCAALGLEMKIGERIAIDMLPLGPAPRAGLEPSGAAPTPRALRKGSW